MMDDNQFRILFEDIPQYLEVIGAYGEGGRVSVSVHSKVHKDEVWHMPTSFSKSYWRDCRNDCLNRIKIAVVTHYGLRYVGRYE